MVYLKGELLKKTPYDYPEMLQRRKKLLSLSGPAGLFCLALIELGLSQ
jgi:hypothetical protein